MQVSSFCFQILLDGHFEVTTINSMEMLRINGERLWENIHYTARWGAMQDSNGVSRLALADEDKCVRDWFVEQAICIGCEVKVDAMGNIFAVLAGRNPDLPPIAMGSHLDTQPAGE